MMLAVTFALGYANDGSMAQTGSALNFSKSRQVQMVSERVHISMGHAAKITVDFVFRNHGNAISVVMGFPDHSSSKTRPAITNFKSWVDGKAVAVAQQLQNSDEFDYAAVWTKTVAFKKGQTRQVKVTYDAAPSVAAWGEMSVDYILKTGATWHGKIDRAEITVDWSRLPKHQRPMIFEGTRPANWRTSGRTASTVFTGFNPTFDLTFQVYHGHWHYVVDGKRIEPPMSPVHPQGDPRDVLFPVEHLGLLFPRRDSNRLEGLRRGIIKRAGVDRWSPERVVEMVYLKDLMAKWGWTYTYSEQTGAVTLRPRK